MNVGSMRGKQLDHGDVPTLYGNVQWRVAGVGPGKIGVGSVVQESTRRALGERRRYGDPPIVDRESYVATVVTTIRSERPCHIRA